MHYSNKGDKNSVDGTWGSYTIQEGENDLFLLNNRNGKKYKFNLTEVKSNYASICWSRNIKFYELMVWNITTNYNTN